MGRKKKGGTKTGIRMPIEYWQVLSSRIEKIRANAKRYGKQISKQDAMRILARREL